MSELRVTNVTGPDGNPTAKFNGVERPEVPPGAVLFFAATTPPPGFLKANGAAVSRTTYAALFAAIGTTFGAGDGSTTFTLPDMRGEFPRGWDDGRGVDSGRVFGAWQGQSLAEHNHGMVPTFVPGTSTQNFANTAVNLDAAKTDMTRTTGNATGTTVSAETRPRNIALLACIKF